jgi:hypothetical protein
MNRGPFRKPSLKRTLPTGLVAGIIFIWSSLPLHAHVHTYKEDMGMEREGKISFVQFVLFLSLRHLSFNPLTFDALDKHFLFDFSKSSSLSSPFPSEQISVSSLFVFFGFRPIKFVF